MKKLILTSAVVLFIAFTGSANNDKCTKKDTKNCAAKECVTDKEKCKTNNACTFAPTEKCNKEQSKCETGAAKASPKKVDL